MDIRSQLEKTLTNSLRGPPGFAVVHSSIVGFTNASEFNEWDYVHAFKSLCSKGWTFAFPTFTFSFTETGNFDPKNCSSEAGALGKIILERCPESIRTSDPIYSFAVIGDRSDFLQDDCPKSTWGKGSVFEKMEIENAHIVMLGCDWKFCTFFHRFEEEFEVPYRTWKDFASNDNRYKTRMFVRNRFIKPINCFKLLISEFEKEKGFIVQPFLDGKIQVLLAERIASISRRILSEDKFSLLENAPEVKHRIACLQESKKNKTIRIAILNSKNIELLKNDFESLISRLVPERSFEIYSSEFGQVANDILWDESKLYKSLPDFTFFTDRLEDLLGVTNFDEEEKALETVDQYRDLVLHYAEKCKGTIFIHKFYISEKKVYERTQVEAKLCEKANNRIQESLGSRSNIIFLDLMSEIAETHQVFDPRLWFVARVPFSNNYAEAISKKWSKMVIEKIGKSIRMIVLDLDDTIWGGVIGEDGIEGIKLGGDYPGNVFYSFQREIKYLSERGIAIAICSKNDEDVALHAINNHPFMALSENDLVTHRINWLPKWKNIKEISEEVGLGLGSILFIDDNPVEREAVKKMLPAVKVLDLSDDVACYAEQLRACNYLEITTANKEDLKRITSYKARKEMNLAMDSAANLTEFYRGLNMRLTFSALKSTNVQRASQLTQKTNQFNTTTRRYSELELKSMQRDGAEVVVIALEDRYIERENIGLIILKNSSEDSEAGEIDLFLLSCRVLGREIEGAIISWAVKRASVHKWKRLAGQIIDTPRNTPVRELYKKCGFTQESFSNYWTIKVGCEPEISDLFQINEELELENCSDDNI